MARPLRIIAPGALYHVTARGDRREPIFVDNFDRNALLDVLSIGLQRADASALAYCLMGNHYHLVVHTRQANLPQLMRHVNGVYTQRFNRRHGLVGHLFQGRYKASLVDRESYLLEVCRYVDLNPVRAGLVAQPGDWPWSSYAAHTGRFSPPPWLDTPALWAALLGQPASTPALAQQGASRYAALVQAARDVPLWNAGEPATARAIADRQTVDTPTTAATLQACLQTCASREQAFWQACRHGGYTMTRIAREVQLSVQQVSRLIARWERQVKGET